MVTSAKLFSSLQALARHSKEGCINHNVPGHEQVQPVPSPIRCRRFTPGVQLPDLKVLFLRRRLSVFQRQPDVFRCRTPAAEQVFPNDVPIVG
jgi:hypothetical protein